MHDQSSCYEPKRIRILFLHIIWTSLNIILFMILVTELRASCMLGNSVLLNHSLSQPRFWDMVFLSCLRSRACTLSAWALSLMFRLWITTLPTGCVFLFFYGVSQHMTQNVILVPFSFSWTCILLPRITLNSRSSCSHLHILGTLAWATTPHLPLCLKQWQLVEEWFDLILRAFVTVRITSIVYISNCF